MNDVGGKESGTGLRPKSSRGGSASDNNFEYDDSEWDVGIGNLIIDLDADIEKNNEASRNSTTATEPSNTNPTTTTSSSSAPEAADSSMHIQPNPANSNSTTSSTSTSNNSAKGVKVTTTSSSGNRVGQSKTGGGPTSSSSSSSVNSEVNLPSSVVSSVNMEHSSTCVDKSLKMKIKRTKPGTKSVEAKHEIVKNESNSTKNPAGTAGSNSVSSVSSKIVVGSSLTEPNAKVNTPMTPSQRSAQSKPDEMTSVDDSLKSKIPKRSTPKKVKTVGGGNATPGFSPRSPQSTATPLVGKKESPLAIDGRSNSSDSAPADSILSLEEQSAPPGSISQKTDLSITVPSVSSLSAFVKTNPHHKVSIQKSGSSETALVQYDASVSTLNQKSQSHTNIKTTAALGSSVHTTVHNKSDKTHASSCSNGTVIEKPHGGSSSSSKKARAATHHDKQNSNSEADGNNKSFTPHGTAQSNPSVDTPRTKSQNDQTNHDACVGTSVGTVTEPDCLGPCEPGTSVTLEGIVWHETENGVLVVNVTWRGKTYVGTLLDCTKNEWASPRFCESPTSDLETRTPKNRAKRGRTQGTGTPVPEVNASPLEAAFRASTSKLRNGNKGGRRGSSNISTSFLAPLSPLKVDPWPKRKTRGSENEAQDDQPSSGASKSTKRIKVSSKESSNNSGNTVRGSSPVSLTYNSECGPYSPTLIECPEPNCSKKYKHINGLKYHQSHAHTNQFAAEDSDSNMSTSSVNNLAGTNNADDLGESSMVDVDGSDIKVDDDVDESNTAMDNGEEAMSIPSKITVVTSAKGTKVAIDFESYEELPTDVPLALQQKGKSKDNLGTANDDRNSGEEPHIQQKLVNPVARTPILTVPSFAPSQNRALTQHQTSSRIISSHSHESHKLDGGFSIAAKGNAGTVPWQPHASSSASHATPMGAASVISSIQPLHGTSVISDGSHSHAKELKSTDGPMTEEFHSKKPKHKKKSKDKRDRERDRDRDGKGRHGVSGNLSRKDSDDRDASPNSASRRDDRKSSSDTIEDEEEGRIRGGESRDREDPQSPAYSDISDANDSGPESDLSGANKDVVRAIPLPSGDPSNLSSGSTSGQGPTHGFPPYFSSGLYSPYSLGENAPPSMLSGHKNADKLDGESSGKGPGNNSSSGPPSTHHPGLPNDRRSPNVNDFRSKYLSPHQQYYSYPYSNFHGFEQSPYGLLPENPYTSHARGPTEDKERELEQMRKTRGEGHEGPLLAASQIKQEPLDRVSKDSSSSGKHQHQSSPTTDSSGDPLRKSGSMPSSITSSKHQKDFSKRGDRDDKERERERHGGGGSGHSHSYKPDNLTHKTSSSKSSHHSDKDKPKHPTDTEADKEKDRAKNEGAKPTMETTGPPPPPTGSYAYIPPGYLQTNPFGLPFDHPMYRQVIVPGPYPGTPYSMHPGAIPRFPATPVSSSIPLPEDLSRPSPPTSGPPGKALDLLQHHAAQYYATHKIHELQERVLKSPSPQVPATSGSTSTPQPANLAQGSKPSSPRSSSPATRKESTLSTATSKGTELSKDVKPNVSSTATTLGGSHSDNSRSPPTQHHVHSHTHHHTHIGYPIIPTVPPQYSPHYPHVITPSAAPTPVIPPFTTQKPT